MFYLKIWVLCSFLAVRLQAPHPAGENNPNPHRPWKWTLARLDDSKVIQTQMVAGSPSFIVHPMNISGNIDGQQPCYSDWIKYYTCPASNPGKSYCNAPGQYYCNYWGCETLAMGWKPAIPDRYLTLTWETSQLIKSVPGVAPIGTPINCFKMKNNFFSSKKLKLTVLLPNDPSWLTGRTWGFRMYITGKDPGVFLFVKKEPIPNPPLGIGPNPVLKPATPRFLPLNPQPTSHVPSPSPEPQTNNTHNSHVQLQPSIVPVPSTPNARLYNLILGAYSALSHSQPKLSQSCWLCLSAAPPYYEGVAVNSSYTNNPSDSTCDWNKNYKLTLSEVSEQGTCIGNPPPRIKTLCSVIHQIQNTQSFLQPPLGLTWACNTGITPCVSTKVFNNSADFCVLVSIYPQILYHSRTEIENKIAGQIRFKREPISVTLAVLLGAAAAAGIGTGTAAIVQSQQTSQLQAAVNEDLRTIQTSISALQNSLTSLSEVVLQNRRGLDMLLLDKGGLCVALKEECCFYADSSGVVKESMTKLKERLDQRQRERQAQQGLFESWFGQSPWLSTLISALAGPLITLLLIITIGPCILKKLINFLQNQIGNVKLMIIRQQYSSVPTTTSDL